MPACYLELHEDEMHSMSSLRISLVVAFKFCGSVMVVGSYTIFKHKYAKSNAITANEKPDWENMWPLVYPDTGILEMTLLSCELFKYYCNSVYLCTFYVDMETEPSEM